eukprot:UN12026
MLFDELDAEILVTFDIICIALKLIHTEDVVKRIRDLTSPLTTNKWLVLSLQNGVAGCKMLT